MNMTMSETSQLATAPALLKALSARTAELEPVTALSGVMRMAGLETIVGLHFGIGHSLLVQRLDPKLKELNLTAKQVTIMWLVEANPDITQIEIARFLAIERSTIHQFARSLVRNGMIRVAQSETDGRSSRIELTDLGRIGLAKAREIIIQHETETTAKLTAIERRLLLDLLHKLVGSQPVG